jgi:hypothetical protein
VCAGELVALLTLTNVLNYRKVQKVDIPKVCAARPLTDICVDDSLQLTEKFGLAMVKEMLKDIVNSCYDGAIEKQKVEGYFSSSVVSLQSLLLALMPPSAPATFGLVSCPSGDVSELLLAPV